MSSRLQATNPLGHDAVDQRVAHRIVHRFRVLAKGQAPDRFTWLEAAIREALAASRTAGEATP
jgi:hypothetical protein